MVYPKIPPQYPAILSLFGIFLSIFSEKILAQSPLKQEMNSDKFNIIEKCPHCSLRTTPIILLCENDKKPLTMVFQDDFDSLNLAYWHTKFQYPPPNDRYVANADCILLDEHVQIKNGILHLNTRKGLTKHLNTERNWSAGQILSNNNSAYRKNDGGCFRHGFFEISAKIPKGAGLWPAFWLFGWAGEIDVFEIAGCNAKRIITTLHNGGYGENLEEMDAMA